MIHLLIPFLHQDNLLRVLVTVLGDAEPGAEVAEDTDDQDESQAYQGHQKYAVNFIP